MVVLLVVTMLIGTTLKKMRSEWLASLFSSLFGALCQRGEIRGVNFFDAMRSQQLEFHVLSVESSLLGVSL